MSNAIGELTTSMAQAHAFAKCDFQMGLVEGKNTVMSPPRKKALASWTIYYNSTINLCAQIVNNLYPIVEQCETIDAENLKLQGYI